MSEIKLDNQVIYTAATKINQIADDASQTYYDINAAHDILALDNVLSHTYGKQLLTDIQSAQNTMKSQKKLMHSYGKVMNTVADELFEAETGSKSQRGSIDLPIISGIISGVIGGSNTIRSIWDDLFNSGRPSHGGGSHSIGEDTSHTENGNVTNDDSESVDNSISDNSQTDDYSIYRSKIDQIGDVEGQKQIKNTNNDGLCTIASMTTLLNRRSALDGYSDKEFDVQNVAGQNGYTYDHSEGTADYYSGSGGLSWSKTYSTNNTSYTSAYDQSIGTVGSYEEKKNYLVSMLEQHPEGIEIYANYSGNGVHAVVLTDYTINESGEIQFYVDDPVYDGHYQSNGGYRNFANNRSEIENSWLYGQEGKSVENLINNIFGIWYLQ